MGKTGQDYALPTLARLNPELYKEYVNAQNQVKDPMYESIQHLKERYGYHDVR